MITRILTAAILIPFVVVAVFFFPFALFAILLDVVLILTLRELGGVLKEYGISVYPPVYPLMILVPWLASSVPDLTVPFAIFSILVILTWSVISTRTMAHGCSGAGGNLFALAYLGVPLAILTTYHPKSSQGLVEAGRVWELAFVFLVVWLSDASAYFVGRAIGKHKITPNVSPNKSLEGYIAALVIPTVAAYLAGAQLVPDKSGLFLSGAALLVAAFGTAGDLFESMLKRGAQIKDSSSLLPGHGGLLDRIDSILFAFPAYYLWSVVFQRLLQQ